jgi:hypothetical protein
MGKGETIGLGKCGETTGEEWGGLLIGGRWSKINTPREQKWTAQKNGTGFQKGENKMDESYSRWSILA